MNDWGDSEWDFVAEYIRWEENENGKGELPPDLKKSLISSHKS